MKMIATYCYLKRIVSFASCGNEWNGKFFERNEPLCSFVVSLFSGTYHGQYSNKIFRTNDLSSLVVTRRWPIQTHNRTTVSINDIIFIYSQTISSRVIYFFFFIEITIIFLDRMTLTWNPWIKISTNKYFDKLPRNNIVTNVMPLRLLLQ